MELFLVTIGTAALCFPPHWDQKSSRRPRFDYVSLPSPTLLANNYNRGGTTSLSFCITSLSGLLCPISPPCWLFAWALRFFLPPR